MIAVHHLNKSRSQRVLWLLEELGLEYEIKFYQRDPTTMRAPPALRRIHPLGKSPTITDGELTLAESGAIVEYLVDTYGNGRLAPGRGTPAYVRYLYWLHYAEGSLMQPMVMKFMYDRIENAPMPFFVKPIVAGIVGRMRESSIDPQVKLHLAYLESELSDSDWFVGNEFSAADVQMAFPLEAAMTRAGLDSSRPHLKQFIDRVHARPAYQRALDRGAGR